MLQELRLKALPERSGRKTPEKCPPQSCRGLGTHLQHEGLAGQARAHADAVHVVRVVDVVLDAMQHPAPGGRVSPLDPSLADGLPGDTGQGIDVLRGRAGKSNG